MCTWQESRNFAKSEISLDIGIKNWNNINWSRKYSLDKKFTKIHLKVGKNFSAFFQILQQTLTLLIVNPWGIYLEILIQHNLTPLRSQRFSLWIMFRCLLMVSKGIIKLRIFKPYKNLLFSRYPFSTVARNE